MQIDVVTVFPAAFRECLGFGVLGRALESGLVRLACWNPRDFAQDRRGTVDDRPFGGGPGMVFSVEPLAACLAALQRERGAAVPVSALGPQGRVFDQAAAAELAGRGRLLLVCGRYEGIDERVMRACVDEEWSIGDYVLSGGELAAAVMIDAVLRLVPGVLGKAASAEQDSFATGLLDCPHYTRPEDGPLGSVPAVLRSGNHAAVARWRRGQSLWRTWLRRPDLLARRRLAPDDQALLAAYIERYMAGEDAPAPEEAR